MYVRIRYKHSIICTVAPTRTYSHTLTQSHPHALILYTIKHLVTETVAGEGDAHQRPVQVHCVCQGLMRTLSMHETLTCMRHKYAQTCLATNVKKTSIKTNKQTNKQLSIKTINQPTCQPTKHSTNQARSKQEAINQPPNQTTKQATKTINTFSIWTQETTLSTSNTI